MSLAAGMRDLSTMLRPRSIALVGATDRSMWSRATFTNLTTLTFDGEVHLVARRGGVVHGRTAATSCAEIGAKIDLARPFQASSTLADLDPREDLRLRQGGEHPFADQMAKADRRRLTIRPCHRHAIGFWVGHGGGDDVVQHFRHFQILSGAWLSWHLIQFNASSA